MTVPWPVADDRVRLALPDGERSIPLDAIKKAKLVRSDDLLATARTERRMEKGS